MSEIWRPSAARVADTNLTRFMDRLNTRKGLRLRELDEPLRKKIRDTIRAHTTPRHVPAKVVAVADLPRTLSGKITELAVRNVIHGLPVKNVDALANPQALEHFRDLPDLTT